MRTALITGISGQDGAYLAELLLSKGYLVYGTYRRTSSVNFWRIEELGIHNHPNLELVEFDLTDSGSAIRLLQRSGAAEVYNLAARSFVGVSFDQPVTTAQITAVGALHLLEAIRIVDPTIRFYQASTSEMFGKVQAVPQKGGHAFPSAEPLWRGQALRALDHGELRGILRNLRLPAASCSTTSPRCVGASSATRKITDSVAKIKLGKLAVLELRQPRRQARLGFCQGIRGGHVAHAAGRRGGHLRPRHQPH